MVIDRQQEQTRRPQATGYRLLATAVSGFTLIEMLAVLVIAGILIGLTIPTVTKLMSSGGVSAGSREVANMLGLARQCAITQRVYARVVFPYSKTGSHPEMWYRTCAVITNRDNTVAAGWGYMTKWEYLPQGAIFFGAAHTPAPAAGAGSLDDQTSLNNSANVPPNTAVPFPDSRVGDVGQLAYIEFSPTGAGTAVPPNSSTPSTLAITEGIATAGPASVTLTPTSTTTNLAGTLLANRTLITVDPLVGRIQVTR